MHSAIWKGDSTTAQHFSRGSCYLAERENVRTNTTHNPTFSKLARSLETRLLILPMRCLFPSFSVLSASTVFASFPASGSEEALPFPLGESVVLRGSAVLKLAAGEYAADPSLLFSSACEPSVPT